MLKAMYIARSLLTGMSRPSQGTRRILNKASNVDLTKRRYSQEFFLSDDEEFEAENQEYMEMTGEYFNPVAEGHRTFIMQPYVKWGEKKKRITTPELQLEEAEALVKTLPNWSVVDKICMPLLSLEKNKLVGKGNMEKLQSIFHRNRFINALFVSKNILRPVQVTELQDALGVPVFDRYAIVMQIFRDHAKTPEARLQVALAELPYVWKKIHFVMEDSGGKINLIESRKKLLHSRETKLRNALKKLKEHRQLIRKNRLQNKIPSIAVVGYTNAGKTSLIKALTGDESLEPKNYLFATLDTTSHQGTLPCHLKVLYMDTIGFIQDVPESLIEPFIATFEDAMIADLIVHVFDASHPDREAQIQHVQQTLDMLVKDERPIINVANKCDIADKGSIPDSVLAVSSINSTGIDLLRIEIERELLAVTGRNCMTIRVKSGSSEYAWLYKETVVKSIEADPNDPEYMLMEVIATPHHLHKFRQFLKQ
ncbi:putative GTP-binding protein 6 [Venturia canescens]|uniref:putative GTP-binding protein 6 n=1 Tax=Venturia canescens TaxID=32260 RepID=UPI001C9C119F|nr:putative GTP-binding protein 6 [Venturia canescens]